MIKVLTRVLAVAGAVVLVLLGTAGTGWAHPFGPPPVAKVRAEGSLVEVTWSAAADDVAALNRADRAGGSIGDYLGRGVGVEQDGRACPLVEVSAQALATTGAVLRFRCPGPAGELRLRVELLTDLDRAYRTVSVTPSGSGALHTADAPVQTIRLDGSAAATGTDLDRFFPLALLAALVAGAFHACAPGHGKTLTAGYLLGGRARPRDAIRLGVVVALMHTLSVAVLAVVWWAARENAPDLEAITLWFQLVAALAVLAVGAGLLRRHLRTPVSHGHGHGHGHGHSHGHGHGHGHDLLTRRGLVTLGVSGGLLPSPSAFLLLLTGLLTGRAVLALVLVAAFGLGMAVTLSGVGLAVLRGHDLLAAATRTPRLQALAGRVPLVAALLVVAGGLVTTAMAVAGLVSG
ncbi:hypothetical protein [Nonomuraea africana]|uniref:ABC-type nickel/cobalt efflux system permease component RcnA n=1 Tax=Nonomuraea africana TaxID=46171 RepID=A0ABR9KNS1_9ACTN|nr:hypothetical protein [Nonomuraea africana]MBE1563672.1 ABC-type nickel/cobalt efflux system permease component RcnA [Nonomuraea africana]